MSRTATCRRVAVVVGSLILVSPCGIALFAPEALAGTTVSATATAIPIPANTLFEGPMTAITCPGTRSCVAVGGGAEEDEPGLIANETSGKWDSIATPVNQGGISEIRLSDVACPAAASCVVVGTNQESTSPYALLLVETSGSWTNVNVPLPANASSDGWGGLTAVSCPTQGACVAVGTYEVTPEQFDGLVLTQTPHGWAATEAPLPSGAPPDVGAGLGDIACTSVAVCTAVGDYSTSATNDEGLLLVDRAGVWTASEAPPPSGASGASLGSVACPAANMCVAGGESFEGLQGPSGPTAGLVETEKAGNWTPTSSFGVSVSLVDKVVCPASTACEAIGSDQFLLIQRPTGWIAVSPPTPPGGVAGSAHISDISCAAAGDCAAVGYYENAIVPGSDPLLVEEVDGTWTAAPPAWPADVSPSRPGAELGAVYCAYSRGCTAVGTYFPSGGPSPEAAFAETPSILSPSIEGARFQGSTGAMTLNKPVVGMAVDPATGGYWLAASDGGVFSFNAPFYGSAAKIRLNKPIVGIAAAPDGDGYYLVASDGGIFAFGLGARFQGSTGNITLSKPVVGMVVDSGTDGYWMVASDGGVFSFNAPFYGSAARFKLSKPVVGMAADAATGGYCLAASDGGVFSFKTPFFGSAARFRLNKPIVGMAVDPATGGYWLVASDGGTFSFNAPFYGSAGHITLNKPVVGMGSSPDSSGYYLVGADGGIFTF